MSRKSERLVNLTIALLATKRYLTKSEIFKSVAGYDGDAEARDRMFERDKDDLRALGIEIELGTFDPLFEDEAGYRIKAESYSAQLNGLSTQELLLLSYASQLWREAVLAPESRKALIKLKSLGVEISGDELTQSLLPKISVPQELPEIIDAITLQQRISFKYRGAENELSERELEPLQLKHDHGFWYLIGIDSDKRELRTFRVDRIASSISTTSKSGAFSREDISEILLPIPRSVSEARIALRKGKGSFLRVGADTVELDDDFDELRVSFDDEESFLEKILWLGSDARILSPEPLRQEIIARLEQVVALHG